MMDKKTTEKLLKESIIYFCQTYIGICQSFDVDVIICISKDPENVDTVFKFHESIPMIVRENEFTDINNLNSDIDKEIPNKKIKLEKVSERAYFCSLCGQKINSFANILLHMINKHKVINSKLCEDCNFMFEDSDTLATHKQLTKHGFSFDNSSNSSHALDSVVNGDINLEINSVPIFPITPKIVKNGQNFASSTPLPSTNHITEDQDIQNSEDDKPDIKMSLGELNKLDNWICSVCQHKCRDFPDLCVHLMETHKLYSCLYCDNIFKDSPTRDEHMATHTRQCRFCGLNFTRQDSLWRHINKYHKGVLMGSISRDIKTSIVSVDEETQESADEKFSHELSNHNSTLSEAEAIEIYSDEVDDDDDGQSSYGYLSSRPPSCRGRRGRFKHITSIDPDRTFMCEVCRINITGVEAYKIHCEQLHLRIPCPYCGCTYTQKASMERHQRQHTGERPYKCHLCCMMYTRKENLHTHLLRTHATNQLEDPSTSLQTIQWK